MVFIFSHFAELWNVCQVSHYQNVYIFCKKQSEITIVLCEIFLSNE